jgi:hypothetical protein
VKQLIAFTDSAMIAGGTFVAIAQKPAQQPPVWPKYPLDGDTKPRKLLILQFSTALGEL